MAELLEGYVLKAKVKDLGLEFAVNGAVLLNPNGHEVCTLYPQSTAHLSGMRLLVENLGGEYECFEED